MQEIKNFIEIIKQSFENNEFIKLTFGKKTKSNKEIQNIYVRSIALKNNQVFSFTYRNTNNQDIIYNYTLEEVSNEIENQLGKNFLNANLLTNSINYQLCFNNKFIPKLLKSKATLIKNISQTHDNTKKRLVNTSNNYLTELGITNTGKDVNKSMFDKYRQINKYIEIIDHLLRTVTLPENLTVYDMGAGKGYLTFALYDYLTNNLHKKTCMKGIEQRENLVSLCNKIAKNSDFRNLEFLTGKINDFETFETNILVALHACDTATDEAIFSGIKNKAEIIIVAPCCHKQIRNNMVIPENMKPILKNGILLERQAELLTDGIRALILEKHGYKSKVFEFISNKHTGKNLMITAVKTDKNRSAKEVDKEIKQLKTMYGIKNHFLEELIENKL